LAKSEQLAHAIHGADGRASLRNVIGDGR